jgi:hypothetical protein
MSQINGINNRPDFGNPDEISSKTTGKKKKFGKVMSAIADGALDAASTVGSVVPGGQAISAAARGLKAMKSESDTRAQLDQMWEMQRENQQFNLEYLQLQNELQADNRRFTTVSNLMKARHDTAKAAINNMNV